VSMSGAAMSHDGTGGRSSMRDLKIAIRAAHRQKRLFEANQKPSASLSILSIGPSLTSKRPPSYRRT
jgi:hypothetical protein